MGVTTIRVGGKKASVDEWSQRQRQLLAAKNAGEIPYCMCMPSGVPMELFTREGIIYFRKIKHTQHSDTCEYGNHKKVVQMPIKQKRQAEKERRLQNLWQEAELNKWHPGLVGKRFWGVIQSRIVAACANHKDLAGTIFAPEAFNKERAEEQKVAALQTIDNIIGKHGYAMIFGELKELRPSKFDTEVVIRHAKFLKLWAKKEIIESASEDWGIRFVLAKIRKSEKGNLYIESADTLLTSKEAHLPCHDETEARLLDSISKKPIAFEIEQVKGITTIATRKPPLRIWIAEESRHEKISDANDAARQDEVIVLLDKTDPEKTINLMLTLSAQNKEIAKINEEVLGFSD